MNDQSILTSAHCFDDDDDVKPINPVQTGNLWIVLKRRYKYDHNANTFRQGQEFTS